MIGLVRMSNTQYVLQDVVASSVQGDFLEAGVWRGGACILAPRAFTSLDPPQRRVWGGERLAGPPPPTPLPFIPPYPASLLNVFDIGGWAV